VARIGAGVLAAATIVLSGGPLAADGPSCIVLYDDDRLTVQVEQAPLADVMREIGRQTGAEIVGALHHPRQVSQKFDGLPLMEGVARLLGAQNFTLRYGRGGELRAVALLGQPLAVGEASNLPVPETAAPLSLGGERQGPGPASVSEEVPDGRLVAAAAGTHASAIASDDPHNGSAESRTQNDASQQDPNEQVQWPEPDELDRKLRRSFLNFLAQMDGGALAEYFTTKDGQKALALLSDFAANHASGSSSDKASEILGRALGQPPAVDHGAE
jgi:hypothetical protein